MKDSGSDAMREESVSDACGIMKEGTAAGGYRAMGVFFDASMHWGLGAGPDRAGQGRAGRGRAGRAGQGMAGQGLVEHRCPPFTCQPSCLHLACSPCVSPHILSKAGLVLSQRLSSPQYPHLRPHPTDAACFALVKQYLSLPSSGFLH